MSFKLDNATIRQALAKMGHTMPEDGKLHLLGVRSCSRHSVDSLSLHEPQKNRYDDVLLAWGSAFGIFTATLDPGTTYTLKPMNSGGCLHIADGTYWYVKGTHKGKPALNPVGMLRIWRDADRDSGQDPSEITHSVDGPSVAANIHRGGTAPTVDSWSAGCIVLRTSGANWDKFWTLVTAAKQTRFRIDVVDGKDYVEALGL